MLVVVGADDEVLEVGGFERFESEHCDGETIILPGLAHDSVHSAAPIFIAVKSGYERLSQGGPDR
ncbi:MAG: hypothetical protein ACFB6R_04370 [Alphaproteobacteria bacterium]